MTVLHKTISVCSAFHLSVIVRGVCVGLSGSTQYRRVPVEFNTLDPFSGVFLDPFNSKGAELYLLERARGEVLLSTL